MALSLYNKYRPQTFSDVVGQHHVEKTLSNAVETGKVSHAYLFCGPRGTGKTTTARILAKALLCAQAPTATPDGSCVHCNEISEGIHPDVYELDAASRTGVDNVREEIIGRVNFAPTHGTHKIYIIDEVHMLSTPAFNALLKTLEEPPEHVIFVLCTTDAHKVPDTVQARCQRFDFKRLTVVEIRGRLQYICEREGFDFEPSALELIAQRSEGGMRDAIRSLEQVAVFSAGKVSYTAAESLLGMVDADQLFVLCNELAAGDASACINWVSRYMQSGSDIAILVSDLAVHVRNLYAVSVARGSDKHLAQALQLEESALAALREQAAKFGKPDRLAWMLTVLGSLSAELKNAANARLALEVALVRILRPESESSLQALTARIVELEAQVEKLKTQPNQSAQSNQKASVASAAPSSTEQGVPTDSKASSTSAASGASERDAALVAGGSKAHAVVHEASSSLEQATSPDTRASEEHAVSTDPTDPTASNGSNDSVASPAPTDLSATQGLYRQWNGVVDAIKKQKPGVAASLGGIKPLLSKDGTRLTLALPATATASRQYLESPTNQTLLKKTIAEVFGKPLDLVMSVDTSVPAPLPEPSKEELDNMLSNSFSAEIQFKED